MPAAPATEPTARARELVRGAYDLHVHVEPDLAKRRIDDLSLARRFAELGLAGFVLKSHYAPTAERAAVVSRRGARHPRPRRDRAQRRRRRAQRAGGRDRRARRRAHRLAADRRLRERGERGRPEAGQAAGLAQDPGRVHGRRRRQRARARSRRTASRACSRSSPATISCSPPGTSAAPRSTRRSTPRSPPGVSQVVVTHPDYPTQGVPVDEQRELAARGAVLERCFAPIHTGKVSWEATFEAIRATGRRAATCSRPISARSRTRRSRTVSR